MVVKTLLLYIFVCNIIPLYYVIAESGLKHEGEDCGSCFCPPTYNAGECAEGLQCIHNQTIADAPGKCVKKRGKMLVFLVILVCIQTFQLCD